MDKQVSDIERLYSILEKVYSAHGGDGCPICKSIDFVLMDIRTAYGFKDGVERRWAVADVVIDLPEFNEKAKVQPEYRTGFDYGRQLPDGQFERHPTLPVDGSDLKQPIRHSYKHLLCGGTTSMGGRIAMTYAKDPNYYGGTFCSKCRSYFQFSDAASGDFVWVDEQTKCPTTEYLGGTHRQR